jgi:hypothetical protein
MNRSQGNSSPQHMFKAISSLIKVSSACMVGTLVLDTDDTQKSAFKYARTVEIEMGVATY